MPRRTFKIRREADDPDTRRLLPMAPARCFHPFRAKSLYWLLSLRSARKKRQEYQIFWLAKHSGGYRPVAAPSLGLKKVQRGILSLLSVGEVSPHATAYQPGCTLLRNAAPHVGQPFVVKLDIANFFGSIPFPAAYAAIDRALCRNPEIQSSAKASSAREGATESYNAALSFSLLLSAPSTAFCRRAPPPARCCPI